MAVEARVLGKSRMAYGIDVDVSYTCPNCGDHITETVCFSFELDRCGGAGALLEDHQCPECGEDIELEIDFD